MSTAIEFNILSSADLSALERHVCTRIGEWVTAGRTVCVVTEDSAAAERLDTLLWTFSDQTFIAHEVATHRDAMPGKPPLPAVLITIGHPAVADVLVNLAGTRRDAGRRRFVAYRERGFPPETLKVGS